MPYVWKYKYPIVKIKDICLLGSGGTPSRSCPQYYKGSIPWIKTGEVLNEEIFETEEHITEDAIANSSDKKSVDNISPLLFAISS